MKLSSTTIALFVMTATYAQPEISTGVAINRNDAFGPVANLGYDFRISGRFYTKSQIGYKHLHRYNDYVGASLDVSIWEFHQTVSYEVVHKKKYIFKPNVGVNYRFYHWRGKIDPPYNTFPQRVWSIGLRNGYFILNSFDNGSSDEYKTNNIGFSIQLQNQFKLTDKVWLHVTPFMEPDYDRSQNTGGCYVGVIIKPL
jgi:hypothetical protein